ncbi:MAG: NADH:quinone oxidoreductase [Robiginitomaculum sp.]|nr:MAG: NADH:quinone oxidoreductase [Robiginitomaculum sp.]
MSVFVEHYNYAVVIVLMMTGLYVVFASSNMIKKLVGLSVFQTSVFLLYITMGKVAGGRPPIIDPSEFQTGHGDAHEVVPEIAHEVVQEVAKEAEHAVSETAHAVTEIAHVVSETPGVIYSNPLPHVLILTAIVVGVATLAIGLALVVRIREAYGSIEEDEIGQLDYQDNLEGHTG